MMHWKFGCNGRWIFSDADDVAYDDADGAYDDGNGGHYDAPAADIDEKWFSKYKLQIHILNIKEGSLSKCVCEWMTCIIWRRVGRRLWISKIC